MGEPGEPSSSSLPSLRSSRFHLEGAPDPSDLRLDPELSPSAQTFEPNERFRLLWLQPNWFQSDADRLAWMLVHPPTTSEPSSCFVPPGLGPAEPRVATWGDVLQAVWAVPCVQAAVNRAFDNAKQAFEEASTAERAAAIGTGTAFTLGMLGIVYADAEVRDLVIRLIEGRRIPVPGVEGLAFSIYRRGMGLEIPIPRVRGLTIEGHFNLGRPRWQDVEYDVRIEYKLMGW